MKRLLLCVGINVLILAVLLGEAWLWLKPSGLDGAESVLVADGGWNITVQYRPGASEPGFISG